MSPPKENPGGVYISVREIYDIVIETRDAVMDIKARQKAFRRAWAWLGGAAGLLSVSMSVAAFVTGQGG